MIFFIFSDLNQIEEFLFVCPKKGDFQERVLGYEKDSQRRKDVTRTPITKGKVRSILSHTGLNPFARLLKSIVSPLRYPKVPLSPAVNPCNQ
jgi:hypothetical protein